MHRILGARSGALALLVGLAACSSGSNGGGSTPAATGGVPGGGVPGAGGAPSAAGTTASGGVAAAGAPASGGIGSAGAPSGGTSGAGAGGTSGASGSVGGGTGGAGGDPMCMVITTDPTLSHANCNNAADRCYFSDHASIAYDIGSQCATDTCKMYAIQPETADAKKCFTDCFQMQMKAQTGGSVSDTCATCSDAVVICGAYGCLSPCLADPKSTDCLTCLCTAHAANGGNPKGTCLIDAFADCAGFKPPPALVGCPDGTP